MDRRTAFHAGIVAAFALALYANTLGGTFVYDDLNAVTGNGAVVTGDVRTILTTPSWWGDGRGTLWRPVTTLTFALDHAIAGPTPLWFHAVNVALHALVSVLVLVVLVAAGIRRPVAFAAALLFASHPVHTEAVANVVGRAELLAAAGFFAAWRCWLATDAASAALATAWSIATTAAFALAMLAKENAVALPVVLLAADLVGPGDEPPAARLRRHGRRYAVLVATALAYVALRRVVLGSLTPAPTLLDNPLAVASTGERLLGASAVIGLYALRLAFPLRLSADYSYDQIPAVQSPLDPRFLAGLAVVVAVIALGWWARRRLPAAALGIALLASTFALVSNLLFPIGTIMGERLLYLPSAGFCLALASTLGVAARGRAFSALLAALVLLYGGRTVLRNAVWIDPLTFARTLVADAPRSARAHAELASALADAGRLDEADAEFERALAITPADPIVLYNWGHALAAAGRWDAAAERYRRAIAIKPDFGRAYENLGGVESARGDQHAALAALRRARELAPDSPYLLMTIANVLARAGSDAEARTTYEEALTARPADPLVLESYGAFLSARGDHRAAVAVLERITPPRTPRAEAALAASRSARGVGQ